MSRVNLTRVEYLALLGALVDADSLDDDRAAEGEPGAVEARREAAARERAFAKVVAEMTPGGRGYPRRPGSIRGARLDT